MSSASCTPTSSRRDAETHRPSSWKGPPGSGRALSSRPSPDPSDPAVTASGDEAETFLGFGVLLQLLDPRPASWSDPFAAGADLPPVPRPTARPAHHRVHRRRRPPVRCRLDHRTDLRAAATPRRPRPGRSGGERRRPRPSPSGPSPTGRRAGRTAGASRTQRPRGRGAGRRPRLWADERAGRQHGYGGTPAAIPSISERSSTSYPVGDLDSPGPLPAPKSYALLVLGALASHSEDAQALARAAAVLADGALVDMAAEVAAVAAPEAALGRAHPDQAGHLHVRRRRLAVRFAAPAGEGRHPRRHRPGRAQAAPHRGRQAAPRRGGSPAQGRRRERAGPQPWPKGWQDVRPPTGRAATCTAPPSSTSRQRG